MTLTNDAMPGLEYIGRVTAKVYHYRGNAWKHIGSTNAVQMANIEREMADVKADFGQEMIAYEKAIIRADDR